MSEDLIGKSLALSCAIIWAFAVILFKRSSESMSPLSLNLFKSTIAGTIMLPIWYYLDDVMIPDTISSHDLWLLAFSGIIGITLADSLFFVCLQKLGAGPYAIIDCIYSPSMIFMSWAILGEPMTIYHIVGSGLVIGGVLLATDGLGKLPNLSTKQIIIGMSAGFAAILLMVFSILIVKPLLDTHSAIMIVECRMIPALLVLNLIAIAKKNRRTIYKSMFTIQAFKMALPASILGNVLSMLTWVMAFKFTDLGSASVLNQTNVIFVVILAAIFLKEPIDLRRGFAIGLGFAGSVVVLSGCF